MKKKLQNAHHYCKRFFVTTFLIVTLLFNSTAAFADKSDYALISEQLSQTMVTLKMKNQTLEQILTQLKKQTGINFGYESGDGVNQKELFSFDIENISVEKALDKLLENSNYSYLLKDNMVVIVKKTAKTEPIQQAKADITVKGKVLGEDKRPIAGATIFVVGTTTGAITDDDGKFSIKMKAGGSIEVTYVGYQSSKRVVNASENDITITLKVDAMAVEDVVITGYQKIERRKMTASISKVNMDDLKSINQPSVDKLLQGQVAGLTVMNTSGAPGAVPQIRIRGTSTLSGNVQPLWVVDGIILDDPINASVDDILTNRNLIASGIGGVNVEDIESISVLKDAAATAIYGTRAANGVIVITSKKGTAGKTSIKYSSHFNISMRPQMEDAYMMNSQERIDVNMEMINKGIFAASSSAAGKYGTATDFERHFIDASDRKISWADFQNNVNQLEEVNTDWFKHVFRNAFTHRHNVSISGGTEKTTFYVSGSYMNDQATAKDVGQETYTGSVKVYTKPWENFRIGGMIDLNVRENDSFFATDSWENPYEWSIYTTRAHNAYKEDGSYNHLYYNGMQYNFMENREAGWRDATSVGIRANVDLEWRIRPDLIFTSLFAYTRNATYEENISTEKSYFVKKRKEDVTVIDGYTALPVWYDGGYLKGTTTNAHSITFRNQLSYSPVINENHSIDLMLGQELRKSRNQNVNDEIYGYVHDRGRKQVPQYDLIEKLGIPYWELELDNSIALSYFGVAGYTYKKRYTVSANARVDGSNRFGIKTNELFQPLWSVGFNYQIKEESFLRDAEWLSYLTVKGSYGTQGNIASQAYSDLVTRIGTIDDVNKDGYLQIVAPKNPYLKWEKNYNSNIALEFGFFKRRLTGSIEYYDKKGVDLLGNKQVSQVTGFSSIQVNWASVRNRGYELSLSSININTKNFRWATNFNIGYNENTVLDVYSVPTANSLTDAQRSNYAASAVIGKPINGLWSYRYAGLDKNGRATFYTEKEGKTVLAGMKNIDGLEYSGTTMPPYQGGITNTFNVGKFTLSVLFVGSFGNVIRLRNLSQGYALSYPDATKNMSKEWVNRWRNPGDENLGYNIPTLESDPWNYDVTSASPYNGKMYDNSNLRTAKGNFVRLQNLSLGYDIYSERMRKAGIQNINLMIQGNNLHVWHSSKIKGQDPEATGAVMKYSDTRTANVSIGNTFLPLPRSFSFSIGVQF